MPTKRTIFLIDGFNLYHSAISASKDLAGATTKWLDIKSLCKACLQVWGKEYDLERIYYFSALAKHRIPIDPNVVIRHEKFLSCLKATGIIVELANFKEKDAYCDRCKAFTKHHEEKETDALSVKLLELFIENECDAVIIMSGDTDIAPAIRTAKRLYPKKEIYCAFPYRRKNKELNSICPRSIKIKKETYLANQFANPFVLPDGSLVEKPNTW
jgi:uncharacterized LabA/DUF88 family protein